MATTLFSSDFELKCWPGTERWRRLVDVVSIAPMGNTIRDWVLSKNGGPGARLYWGAHVLVAYPASSLLSATAPQHHLAAVWEERS